MNDVNNGSSLGRHRFAVLAVVATFPLVFVGGAVTSKNAGMAVPDWPLSFGSVNPPGWWEMDQVNYEHGHRLLGTTVGLLVLTLAVWTGWRDPRKSLRSFAYALLAAVVVQGLLGGIRVLWDSKALALIHGCTAQLFFAGIVVMACVSAPGWCLNDYRNNYRQYHLRINRICRQPCHA
jgi:cytochrome c oxidase assembly protein subunit 15